MSYIRYIDSYGEGVLMIEKLSHKELGELLTKAKMGDESSFEKLYETTVSSQYFIALKNTRDATLAQEVIQELYVKLFVYMNKIENPELFIAYLNKMNYSISMDLIAKQKRDNLIDIDEIENGYYDQIVEWNSNNHPDNLLQEALDELDSDVSEIIRLRYLEEFQVQEIASKLSISRRTVTRKLKFGLKELKKIIARIKSSTYSFVGFIVLTVVVTIKNNSNCLSQGRLFPIFYYLMKGLSSFNLQEIFNQAVDVTQMNNSIIGKLILGFSIMMGMISPPELPYEYNTVAIADSENELLYHPDIDVIFMNHSLENNILDDNLVQNVIK